MLSALHSGPPVVAFANDWATDPTSKHHLMRLLAEQRNVLWVESSGMRRPAVTSGADWSRISQKLRKMAGGVRPGAPGMTVLSPPAVPMPGAPLVQRLNAALYGRAVQKALRGMGHDEQPVLWVYTPTVARYLDHLPARGLVYHCVDRWWEFEDYDREEMLACHRILCQRATHVFASSTALLEDCLPLTPRATYVPHGVEWEHFRGAAVEVLPRPDDLPDTGRQVIGFIGLLDHWVDLDLVRAVARQYPEAEVLLIGAARVPMDTVLEEPNVRWLGRKPFAALPNYLQACDVALIPFLVNELTVAVNPIKLREYLSAGVPVVTTALPEVLGFREEDGVSVAQTTDDFVAAVGRYLSQPLNLEARQRLSQAMYPESWPGRLAEMMGQLKGLI